LLNKVEVYTSSQDVPTLEINEEHRPELDLIHIVSIDGLDPVKASVSTMTLSDTDEGIVTGTEVPSRNIVLTLRPDPDWSNWTPEQLRRLIYAYFIPKSQVRLVFYTDELDSVEIFGTVESCSYNQFIKDPEYQISIICSDPYFKAIEATEISGTVIEPEDWPPSEPITIEGDIPVGFELKLSSGYDSGELTVQVGDPSISTFHLIVSTLPNPNIFEMNSKPLRKFVRTVEIDTGIITNLLGSLEPGYGSVWPILRPGDNLFAVMGSMVGDAWELKYFPKFGGL